YHLTFPLDALRRTDFTRLDQRGEVYVDYMGGALYPERLIRSHTEFLVGNILGNTHSVSNSSKLSLKCADEARVAVLSYFKATPEEYTVIFTANASAAIKLIGEAYQFRSDSKLVIGEDAHNSVHGLREFAKQKGAQTLYIPSTRHGGVDLSTATSTLHAIRPHTPKSAPCLYAITAQSNISNSKTPLSLAHYAASIGYHVLLDAAALAPTSILSLSDSAVDAMAISFYKMFGFPTGVGALIAKKTFLQQLRRPWFAGGTVDIVQVPGEIMTRARQIHEQFEDGTINYLSLPAITNGLKFLSEYIRLVPLRLTSLLLCLSSALSKLNHDVNGAPVVRVLSRLPSQKLQYVGEQADVGFILSLVFLDPSGSMIPNSFIEFAATTQSISLRTGCMCNTGGAAAMLGMTDKMQQLYPGVTLADFEERVGHELGVVRISLGIASNFHDVWRVIQFATCISQEQSRRQLWSQWVDSRKGQN
ncbi:PLP-dependent transferase, partial [Panaeolus papilionaceus]